MENLYCFYECSRRSGLERIARELILKRGVINKDNSPTNTFCVVNEIEASDLNLDVAGAGKVIFPINNEYIQKLISVSSVAKFGLGDEQKNDIVLDKNVHNTREIKADKLQVSIKEFSLSRILSKIKNGLGLAENSTIIPYLYNMLIYSKNNFFKQRQYTEKLNNLIGTLVIVLPVSHIGGDLIIHHGKESCAISTENVLATNAKCISFYSDCIHEVTEVEDGHSVCLTYNLILQLKEFLTKLNADQNLKNAVMDYFSTETSDEGNGYRWTEPKKLVYFLDHSYSEFGLKWEMLKGDDRTNALRIYSVANELELVHPYLALAEIREPFDEYNVYDDKDENGPYKEPCYSYWVNKNNEIMPFKKLELEMEDICWTKKTTDFESSRIQMRYLKHEGNFLFQWYRRAAIVLWRNSDQIPMNFILNYNNALEELYMLTHSAGNKNSIFKIIKAAGARIHDKCIEEDSFVKMSTIALYIEEKETAISILSFFGLNVLCPDTAELFVKLQTQYSVKWCIGLLNNLDRNMNEYSYLCQSKINSFTKNFLQFGGNVEIVNILNEKLIARHCYD